MPKSKTRPRAAAAHRPARGPTPAPTPERALEVATLALTQASLELVREAELRITQAAREGEGVDDALDLHHHLRSAALGLYIAYCQLAGLPDPRGTVTPP